MNNRIQVSLGRLGLYLQRLERDLVAGDRTQALADCAELSEISRRLWDVIADRSTHSTADNAVVKSRRNKCKSAVPAVT
jgi:hypothetical protein